MNEIFEDRSGVFRKSGYTASVYLRHKTEKTWLVRIWKGYSTETIMVLADDPKEAALRGFDKFESYHQDQVLAQQIIDSQDKEAFSLSH